MAAYDKGPFVDAIKILRTQVIHRLREHNWNELGVTSPGYGEGKTLTAVNLAVSLAMEMTQTVLLVDANLRNPSVHELFGLKNCPGFADYLLDNQVIEDLLVHPGIGRFVLLPGGRAISNSTEILTSPKMLALVEEFKDRYPSRIVILIFHRCSIRRTCWPFLPTRTPCSSSWRRGKQRPRKWSAPWHW